MITLKRRSSHRSLSRVAASIVAVGLLAATTACNSDDPSTSASPIVSDPATSPGDPGTPTSPGDPGETADFGQDPATTWRVSAKELAGPKAYLGSLRPGYEWLGEYDAIGDSVYVTLATPQKGSKVHYDLSLIAIDTTTGEIAWRQPVGSSNDRYQSCMANAQLEQVGCVVGHDLTIMAADDGAVLQQATLDAIGVAIVGDANGWYFGTIKNGAMESKITMEGLNTSFEPTWTTTTKTSVYTDGPIDATINGDLDGAIKLQSQIDDDATWFNPTTGAIIKPTGLGGGPTTYGPNKLYVDDDGYQVRLLGLDGTVHWVRKYPKAPQATQFGEWLPGDYVMVLSTKNYLPQGTPYDVLDVIDSNGVLRWSDSGNFGGLFNDSTDAMVATDSALVVFADNVIVGWSDFGGE